MTSLGEGSGDRRSLRYNCESMPTAPTTSGPVVQTGPRVTIGARLGLSFVAILVLFGGALVVVLRAVQGMADAEQEVVALDVAKRAGHRVAALVREQYIHQAHMIIEGNRSHLVHYEEVAAVTREATDDLSRHARTAKERALCEEISSLVRKNHDDFGSVTLRAIDAKEHDEVVRLHADTELVVGGVTRRVKELNAEFQAESDEARRRADTQRTTVRRALLGSFGAAALSAALLGMWTTRSIGARVRVLRDGARRLGDGDLSQRVPLGGSDELADLATAFDEMAARLLAHRDALVRSQKLATIGQLSAGVAHEINGPLGIILGYAQVIRRDGADDEALSAIEDEARQCQRIVQALLDMSRTDAPVRERVALAELVRDGAERLRASGLVDSRAVNIVAPDEAHVRGDEAKLRQVVLNILRNALEATAPGGAVDVVAGSDGGLVTLTILDRGAGLAAEVEQRLFEPFFTTKARGTGLGLAIARAIVEAHGGTLTLAARSGGGACATLTLAKAGDSEAA